MNKKISYRSRRVRWAWLERSWWKWNGRPHVLPRGISGSQAPRWHDDWLRISDAPQRQRRSTSRCRRQMICGWLLEEPYTRLVLFLLPSFTSLSLSLSLTFSLCCLFFSMNLCKDQLLAMLGIFCLFSICILCIVLDSSFIYLVYLWLRKTVMVVSFW